jgi:hypothetical protein
MQINYQPAGSSSTTFANLLVDEAAGGVVLDFKPKGVISVQRDPLAVTTGATNSTFRQPMGNVTQIIPLVVQQFYPTRAAALAAINTVISALLTVKNDFQICEPSGSPVLYYKNAVCASLDADLTGSTVQFRLTLETDLVKTSYP